MSQADIGLIGLAVMGENLVLNMANHGFTVAVYNRTTAKVDDFMGDRAQGKSIIGTYSPEELLAKLKKPRRVMMMVQAGEAVDRVIDSLLPLLDPGDILIDGGNSNYKDSIRRSEKASDHGVDFLDAGTSGGIWGLQEGYALMVGGDKAAYERLEPIFQSLAPAADRGVGRVGPSGAGHFTKMIHNGIEYGMMQAYAEGFEILAAKSELAEDLEQISKIWQHGSVVRSWLLDLAVAALEEDGDLSALTSYVDDSGEGRWTVQESVDLGVPAPVITASLQARFRSRQANPFGGRMLAALRNQFGGHAVQKSE